MHWKGIDRDNLPEGEVLALNLTPKTYGYKDYILGYLDFDIKDAIICTNEFESLTNCTHFMEIELPILS